MRRHEPADVHSEDALQRGPDRRLDSARVEPIALEILVCLDESGPERGRQPQRVTQLVDDRRETEPATFPQLNESATFGESRLDEYDRLLIWWHDRRVDEVDVDESPENVAVRTGSLEESVD